MFKTSIAYENWKKKYKYENETPIETFERVARFLASVEKPEEQEEWRKKFLKVLVRFDENNKPIGLKCTPGGRITANAGTNFQKATMMNCFISGPVSNAVLKYNRKTEDGTVQIPITLKTDESPDDIVNIFLTILEQAKTLAAEGGYGINFDFIRPRGSLIKGTGVKHPGVVSYMNIWDSVSECIVKGIEDGYIDKIKNHLGKENFEEVKQIFKTETRKGAMLAALSCFSRNTEILTNKGWIVITDLISRVLNGEEIKAIDENNNLNEIYNPFKKEPEQLYEIETETGERLEVTINHQFEVRNMQTNKIYLKKLKEINFELEEVKIIQINKEEI